MDSLLMIQQSIIVQPQTEIHSGSDLLAQNTLYLCPWCLFDVVTLLTLYKFLPR